MVKKTTESNSIVGKEDGQPSYAPNGPLPDEVRALARKVFLKFDLMLVLPMITMFCGCQYEYY